MYAIDLVIKIKNCLYYCIFWASSPLLREQLWRVFQLRIKYLRVESFCNKEGEI